MIRVQLRWKGPAQRMKLARMVFYSFGLLILFACTLETTVPAALLTATSPPLLAGTPVQPAGVSVQSVTPLPSISEQGIGPDVYPPNVNPLTGQAVTDPSLLNRRPVAVKVNNYPRSNRPQWGLSLADIVYEYYHNNDLPRFHAIFYGNDASLVGPIRSARMLDDQLVAAYQSVFAFAKADYRVMDRLLERDFAARLVYLLDGVCPPRPVCRYQPATDNFLVADTAQVGPYVVAHGGDNTRPRLSGMFFQEEAPPGGGPLSRLYVRYSFAAYLYWDHDPQTGRYFRYQDTREDYPGRGEAYALLTDRLTGELIAADNVVVLVIEHFHEFFQPATDATPKVEVVDMRFTGRGTAYALRDGLVYQVEWLRAAQDSPLTLVQPDGQPYPFKPGTTWFQVVSQATTLELGADAWRFEFSMP